MNAQDRREVIEIGQAMCALLHSTTERLAGVSDRSGQIPYSIETLKMATQVIEDAFAILNGEEGAMTSPRPAPVVSLDDHRRKRLG